MGELLRDYPVWAAFLMTIKLTLAAGVGSLIIGTVIAAFRLSPMPVLRSIGALYVNVVRNTPLTLLMVFASLGLWATMGIQLGSNINSNNFRFAVAVLAVYTAAFVCEAIRSGVNTVPLGQAEAARSLGLGFFQTLTLVILPQSFRAALVPLGNAMIALTKNSTVASVIGVADLASLQATMTEDRADLMYQIFALVSLLFVVLTLPMGLGVTRLSKRLVVKR